MIYPTTNTEVKSRAISLFNSGLGFSTTYNPVGDTLTNCRGRSEDQYLIDSAAVRPSMRPVKTCQGFLEMLPMLSLGRLSRTRLYRKYGHTAASPESQE